MFALWMMYFPLMARIAFAPISSPKPKPKDSK